MNPHDSAQQPGSDLPSKAPVPYPLGAVLVLLWLVAALVANPIIPHAGVKAEYVIQVGLDPNVAPWWELSLLPRLGPSVAHEMVQHRTQRRTESNDKTCVFGQASDLLSVHGIGPKTLLRLGPHLRFDSCLLDPTQSLIVGEPPS